jgi:glutathione synthase/RimK-type ligase-like ATP-grasp enzyme
MTPLILIWGLSGDPPTMALLCELTLRDVAHVFLDQQNLHYAELRLGADHRAGCLEVLGQSFELEAIRSVFARPRLPAQALDRQLYAWTEMTSARVVNRPSAAASNDSKPWQVEQIREHGFRVPPTLMTTTPDAAREFIACHREVIYKAAGRSRSCVTRVRSLDQAMLDTISHCPTQFQAYVPGVDWRVHVIGDEVHACRIRCEDDDYRLAGEQGRPLSLEAARLPSEIADRCRVLSQSLNLPFAGIDLRHDDNDAWHCFEVNPSPAFTFFERATGQPLTAALARFLIDPLATRAH